MALDCYNLTLITAPTAEPVTGLDFASWGQDTSDLPLYEQHIPAARKLVEERTGRWLMTQTWDFYLDSFPSGAIELPRGPWQSITHVKYNQISDGVLTTWSSAEYQVDLIGGRIMPAFGYSYPSARAQLNAVVIRIVGGYASAALVPQEYKEPINGILLDWVVNRRMVFTIPAGVEEQLKLLWSGRF